MTTNALNINDDGLPVFTASTGQFDGVELAAKGDLLTRTTSLYVRQGVGSDGEFLTADSAQTTGLTYDTAASGSSVIFLETQTAASSSSVNFTNFDDSTYAYYILTYTNVRPSSDGVEFWIRVSINGGSSYLTSDYNWVRMRLSSSDGSDTQAESFSDSRIRVTADLGNATGEGISGRALFFPSFNPDASRPGCFIFDNTLFQDNGTMYRNWGGGANETSSVINAVRFMMSSSNIATGTFKLYGVENS